jgi:hypothetical protein
MIRKTSKSVCTVAVVVPPDPLPPTSAIYSVVKTPENQMGTLMTLNLQMKEISK